MLDGKGYFLVSDHWSDPPGNRFGIWQKSRDFSKIGVHEFHLRKSDMLGKSACESSKFSILASGT
jgi:hypothetical protein